MLPSSWIKTLMMNNTGSYQTQHDAFQEASLLNIVTEYGTTIYDKLACRTSPLGGEACVREIITSAYPRRCLEVFNIS